LPSTFFSVSASVAKTYEVCSLLRLNPVPVFNLLVFTRLQRTQLKHYFQRLKRFLVKLSQSIKRTLRPSFFTALKLNHLLAHDLGNILQNRTISIGSLGVNFGSAKFAVLPVDYHVPQKV